MSEAAALKHRDREVLRAVVEIYLESGEPVSSLAVAKRVSGLKASPATIRNVMAELEEQNLLRQPHTSAGRAPTELGLRYYLDQLMSPKMRPWDRTRLEAAADAHDPSSLSHGLAGLAGQLTIVAVPSFLGARFREIGLMRVDPGRFAAFFVAPSGVVQQTMVEVDFDLSEDELKHIQNFLNERLRDRSLEEVRHILKQELQDDQLQYDTLRRQALTIGQRVVPTPEVELYVGGQSHLVDQPEFADLDRLKSLLRAIEEKGALLTLLSRIVEGPGVKVLLGSEHELREMLGMAAVGAWAETPAGQGATVAILGPTRMDYGRLVPLVDYASMLLSRQWPTRS
ncbi:MAG: heat-inducible transcriptional repressor HrcA [Myxococcota bacterium]